MLSRHYTVVMTSVRHNGSLRVRKWLIEVAVKHLGEIGTFLTSYFCRRRELATFDISSIAQSESTSDWLTFLSKDADEHQ